MLNIKSVIQTIRETLQIPHNLRIGQYVINNYIQSYPFSLKEAYKEKFGNTELGQLITVNDFYHFNDEKFVLALFNRDDALQLSLSLSESDKSKFDKMYNTNISLDIYESNIPNIYELEEIKLLISIINQNI